MRSSENPSQETDLIDFSRELSRDEIGKLFDSIGIKYVGYLELRSKRLVNGDIGNLAKEIQEQRLLKALILRWLLQMDPANITNPQNEIKILTLTNELRCFAILVDFAISQSKHPLRDFDELYAQLVEKNLLPEPYNSKFYLQMFQFIVTEAIKR